MKANAGRKDGGKSKDRIMIVTEKDYREQIEEGIEDEFLVKPGRYKVRRGARLRRGDTVETKVRITISLDADVLEYFKRRAAGRHAAPYQTQINNELRAVMEGDTTGRASPYEALVNDEAFIAAVAAKLAARSKEQTRK
jgi:uncharacterized protein (DUF4415 family)